jgi:outer membrane immunogenic protein
MPAGAADTYERGPSSFKDEAVTPCSSWAGFYLGAHLGCEWGNVGYNTFDLFNSQKARQGSFNANGVTGGGQLGYNFRVGPWV